MVPNRHDEPKVPKGDHIIAIIAKSIGIAAVLVGVVWAGVSIAYRFF